MKTYDPHKTTSEVRQGSGRLDNFWVLLISTAVVVVLFGIIYFVFLANTPPSAV
jgi:succinate dehydrogenase hydrophobic anchor subunit